MCLIFVNTPIEGEPSILTGDQFYNASVKNGHGIGFMYVENGRVVVKKFINDYINAKSLFNSLTSGTGTRFACHLRMATHGAKDEANCHPYKVLSKDDGDPVDLWLMHNGIISSAPTTNKDMSDTWNYVENVLKPFMKKYPELRNEPLFKKFVERDIGINNKFTTLDSDGNFVIYNESIGKTYQTGWLSNTYSIEEPLVFKNYGNSHGYSQVYSEYWNGKNKRSDKKKKDGLDFDTYYSGEYEERYEDWCSRTNFGKGPCKITKIAPTLSYEDTLCTQAKDLRDSQKPYLHTIATKEKLKIDIVLDWFKEKSSFSYIDIEDLIRTYPGEAALILATLSGIVRMKGLKQDV